MSKFLKTLLVVLVLSIVPMRHYAQQPQFTNSEPTISVDITNISLFDERIFFLYHLVGDSRFDVVVGEQDGIFVVSADEAFDGIDLQEAFADFREHNAQQFALMGKKRLLKFAAHTSHSCPPNLSLR